jgi:hypothetical protein
MGALRSTSTSPVKTIAAHTISDGQLLQHTYPYSCPHTRPTHPAMMHAPLRAVHPSSQPLAIQACQQALTYNRASTCRIPLSSLRGTPHLSPVVHHTCHQWYTALVTSITSALITRCHLPAAAAAAGGTSIAQALSVASGCTGSVNWLSLGCSHPRHIPSKVQGHSSTSWLASPRDLLLHCCPAAWQHARAVACRGHDHHHRGCKRCPE